MLGITATSRGTIKVSVAIEDAGQDEQGPYYDLASAGELVGYKKVKKQRPAEDSPTKTPCSLRVLLMTFRVVGTAIYSPRADRREGSFVSVFKQRFYRCPPGSLEPGIEAQQPGMHPAQAIDVRGTG